MISIVSIIRHDLKSTLISRDNLPFGIGIDHKDIKDLRYAMDATFEVL